MAAGLPAVTACSQKMGAVACEGPAVVEGPLHLHMGAAFDPVKEHAHMDVVTMEIMQPQQLRVVAFRPFEKFPGGFLIGKAVVIQQTGAHSADLHPQIGANPVGKGLITLRHIAVPSIGDHCLVTLGGIFLRQGTHDLAGAANTADGVDQ